MAEEKDKEAYNWEFYDGNVPDTIAECKKCAAEHRQLAEWLKDYKRLLEQESKTGHWISGHEETGALGITYTEKICSNCRWNHSLVIPKNYCPNCGAKMIGSEGI